MQDLNDLYYFVQVVEHGGFAAAARVLGVPKSKLSRRIARLEDTLNIRLIRRSTRRFSVTEIGQDYHRHCAAMVAEAEAAQEAIDRNSAEPQGLLRVSCPIALIQSRMTALISRFLAEHPRVRLHLEATNRRVDLIAEGFDVALRVRPPPLEDTGLVVRMLEGHGSVLVASPGYLAGRTLPLLPHDFGNLDTLDMTQPGDEQHVWRLTGPAATQAEVRHRPRLITDEMMTLRQAALDGLGIASLGRFFIAEDLARGSLVAVLPEWEPPFHLVHAVFPSRRGLLPSVRQFIDALVSEFASAAKG